MSLATKERSITGSATRTSASSIMSSIGSTIDGRIARLVRPYSLTLLRYSLGIVFIWFGALKLFGTSPVAELVTAAVPFVDANVLLPLLGVGEVALGVALIIGRWLSIVAAALVGHLCGTFLVLVMAPGIAFQGGNPLLLTTEGEFVMKNLVLISAALVIASRLRAPQTAS
jgi:putative oxidoreductase